MAKKVEEICGGSDILFALPTDGTAGELVTGTGEAHSFPNSSIPLTAPFLQDGGYLSEPYAVAFNGSTTSTNAGSEGTIDDLADNAFTAEGWFRYDGGGVTAFQRMLDKTGSLSTGWTFSRSTNSVSCIVYASTTNATATFDVVAGKWHHIAITFDDAGDRKLYLWVDGVNVATSSAAVGAIVSDAANDLFIGNRSDGFRPHDGAIGWIRISDNIRYTTDFIPPRAFPANDGNTVRLFNMNEGTGTTIADDSTNAQNATLSNGTWESQWDFEGTPIIPESVEFNGTNTSINCGSNVAIDDLADNMFTAEAWIRADSYGENNGGVILGKIEDTSGWFIQVSSLHGIACIIGCDTTNALSRTGLDDFVADGKWHHVTMFFNDAGDRKIYIAIDGVWVSSYTTQTAGVGAITSDVAKDLIIGDWTNATFAFDGAIAFARISDNDRYTAGGGNFTPPARTTVVTTDGNTIAGWNFNEGVGTTLDNFETTAAIDGTISNGSWNISPDMEIDSSGKRIYNWGIVLGSDAANEGIYQDLTVTAGDDYYISAIVESDGLVSQPKVILYDQTNLAEIGSITGVAGEALGTTKYEFTGEIPAGCTNLRVKVVNVASTGEIYIHRVVLLPVTIDNPSFEGTYDDESGGGGGTVNVAPNWNNFGVATDGSDTLDESATAHSGAKSQLINVSAALRGVRQVGVFGADDKWYLITVWLYGASGSVNILDNSGSIINENVTPSVGSWTKFSWIGQGSGAVQDLLVRSSAGGAANFLVDDVNITLLDDVSLTIVPASRENSTG